MAGISSPLDSMYQTFLGQTTEALNQPTAPWQQELMESVNPDKVRRENIKKALAQASMALATTPGDFLTGLSAAAGTGANAYLTAKDDAEQNRMKAMQIAQAANQQAQDRRLQLLYNAIGVNRDIKSAETAAEETAYKRGRDAKADERQARLDTRADAESEARTAYYNRRGTGITADGTGMTSGQVLTTKRAIRRELDGYEKELRDSGINDPLPEEEIQRRLDDRRMELEDYYGITMDAETPQTVSGGKQDQVINKGASPAPANPGNNQSQPIREGTTAVNKQTGERIIYRNGQWQPIL